MKWFFKFLSVIWIFRMGSSDLKRLAGSEEPVPVIPNTSSRAKYQDINNFLEGIRNPIGEFESLNEFISGLLALNENAGIFLDRNLSKKFLSIWTILNVYEKGRAQRLKHPYADSVLRDEAHICKTQSLGSFEVLQLNYIWSVKPSYKIGRFDNISGVDDIDQIRKMLKGNKNIVNFINTLDRVNFTSVCNSPPLMKRHLIDSTNPAAEIVIKNKDASIILCYSDVHDIAATVSPAVEARPTS